MGKPALFLFGPPRLMRNGTHLPVHRKKIFALLSYLAVHGRGFSRESLATLFWPDSEDSRGRSNLRKILSDLHGLLGRDVLSPNGALIGPLNTELLWIDVAEFQHRGEKLRCGQGDPREEKKELGDLIALYTDDFMAGFRLKDCDRYDEWQFLYAEYLRQELCSSLECYIELCERDGDVEAGIQAGRRLIDLDPLNESGHRAMMRLFLMGGEEEAARIQYRICEEMLKKELGVQPEQETFDLFEKTRDPAAARTVRISGRASIASRSGKPLIPTYEVVREIRSEKSVRFSPAVGSAELQAGGLCMMGDFVLRSSAYRDGNILQARKYFGRAIRLDPTCSDAYAGLAFTYFSLGGYGVDARIGERRKIHVDTLVEKALENDPHNSRALMIRAGKSMEWDWDFDTAERYFISALETNPDHADTLLWFAEFLMVFGRFDEAYPYLHKAHELNPLDIAVNYRLAKYFLRTGEQEKSFDLINRLVEVYPNRYLLVYLKTMILLELGRTGEAVRNAEACVEIQRNIFTLATLSIAQSLGGEGKRALLSLEQGEREYLRSGGEDGSLLALAHHAAGHSDEAFQWLDRAFLDHDICLISLPTEPLWGKMHWDPRFQAFLERVGIPPCLDYMKETLDRLKALQGKIN